MIANVTYGYTSASFSGRMPCVDIADAIVSTGRKALEQAKIFIESVPAWNATVEYGDTDRLVQVSDTIVGLLLLHSFVYLQSVCPRAWSRSEARL